MTGPDQRDPYEILQVSPNAEPEVIEAAYRRLARKYHPDVDKSPNATVRMQLINWAYEILSDPDRRRGYDRNNHSQGQRQTSPTSEVISEQIIRQTTLSPDKSCRCWRCGYEWTSRKRHVPPAVCPRCRSDDWHVHRRFKCQDCGHTFVSGNLLTSAYALFPSCPACHSSSWHLQEEERRKREEERRKQEQERRMREEEKRRKQEEEKEKRSQELNVYLQQVKSARLHPVATFLRFWGCLFLLSVLMVELVAVTDDTLQREEVLTLVGCMLGFSALLLVPTFLFPKERSFNSRRLDKLVRTKKITSQEAEWIKRQILPEKPIPARSSVQVSKVKDHKHTKASSLTLRKILATLWQVLLGIIALAALLCIGIYKVLTGVLRFFRRW